MSLRSGLVRRSVRGCSGREVGAAPVALLGGPLCERLRIGLEIRAVQHRQAADLLVREPTLGAVDGGQIVVAEGVKAGLEGVGRRTADHDSTAT